MRVDGVGSTSHNRGKALIKIRTFQPKEGTVEYTPSLDMITMRSTSAHHIAEELTRMLEGKNRFFSVASCSSNQYEDLRLETGLYLTTAGILCSTGADGDFTITIFHSRGDLSFDSIDDNEQGLASPEFHFEPDQVYVSYKDFADEARVQYVIRLEAPVQI